MQKSFILAKKRNGKYCREKGNNYERKIAKELNELGFDVVTSRSESKNTDNNKVDLIDKSNKLPLNIQLKKVLKTPNYFTIRSESTVDPITFCIIWAKQESGEKNMKTVGEVAIIDKRMLYQLLKPYGDGKGDSDV